MIEAFNIISIPRRGNFDVYALAKTTSHLTQLEDLLTNKFSIELFSSLQL